MKDLGLCFVCFGKHLAHACKNKVKCSNCKGRHHPLLCSNSVDSECLVNDRSASTETKANFSSAHYAHSKMSNETTLMQVIKTTTPSTNSGPVEVSVLFDGESDRSFISGQTVHRLGRKKVALKY